MKYLKSNIRWLRNKLTMSQYNFGDLLNVGRYLIWHWEAGTSQPQTDDLKRISLIFEISIHDICLTDLSRLPPFIRKKRYEDIQYNLSLPEINEPCGVQ